MTIGQAALDLADWRRRVGHLYRIAGPDALAEFRQGRDRLFATHPQSPIPPERREAFMGLKYFAGNPSFRVACMFEPAGEDEPGLDIDTGGEDGVVRYRRAGRLRFELLASERLLTVFSLIGYGGGLFLPFRDGTSGSETYGGGRYLFDTVKNTDGLCLEIQPGSPEVVIDFNYAYNPSCAYDARWACPLAPPENRLDVEVRAGERTPSASPK
jgi:uncharacterized protein (DUF1684 family)